MKKILLRVVLLLLLALFTFTGINETQTQAKSYNKAKYTNQFVKTAQGDTYYYNSKGKKLKKKFHKTKTGNTYYFGKNGKMVKGWNKIGKNYYYFNKSGGAMNKSRTVDGIKINKKGTIKLTNYNLSKIKTLKYAEKIVGQITGKNDSKAEKLKKCYDWIISFPYHQYREVSQVSNKNWETIFANDIFEQSAGCCVSESAAFAFLARACGYTEVYVCNDTGHGWAEIDGYVYDPLFSEAKNYNKYYKCTYSIYRLSPIGGRVIV